MRTWSTFQQNIFNFVESGEGNAIIKAVAGSGKTTTIVEALSRVKGNSIFLAFNKSIAEELKSRGVNARTFHSLTYSPVMRAIGARSVDSNKLRGIIADTFSGADARTYGTFCARLVGLARQAGIGCLIDDTDANWFALVDHHDLEVDGEGATIEQGVALARGLLRDSNEARSADFDDLLYFAVKNGVSLPKFDFVFVDEAQDTNAIQRAILRKIMHSGTRVVAVGDPAQAIYGFRGADSDSMNLIRDEFDAIELPLTVSYRCPQSVVRFAQQWVEHIEAAPTAQEGAVTALDAWNATTFEPTDLVVCRTTKPLIALAYRMLASGVGVKVMGREIGEGLKSTIEKQKAKGIPALIEKLTASTARDAEKARAKGRDDRAAALNDRTDAILCLIEALDENERSIPALLRLIDRIFNDQRGVTTLATIHKAKGFESERVYWLNSSQCPSRWARKDWQKAQEINLCYVAATRAKAELVLIEDK